MRIEKILCTVLHETHKRHVKETMETLSERTEGFYGRVTWACVPQHFEEARGPQFASHPPRRSSSSKRQSEALRTDFSLL